MTTGEVDRIATTAAQEQVFESHGYRMRYKFRPPSGDRRHLIVVFNGIKEPGQYDFDGRSSQSCKAGMLWIEDLFGGGNAYYICKNMDTSVAEAVNVLIREVLARLGLEATQCTLLGFSKGGSAALYIGSRFDYKNIVATVPQVKIGSFARDTYPEILSNMSHSSSSEDIVELNALIPQAIQADGNTEKNIYLFSSPSDSQFPFHIEPFVSSLVKYSNFNMIMTNSPDVRHHGEVTYYNLPLVLSILYALTEGIPPRLGLATNGSGTPYAYPDSPSHAGAAT